MSISTVEIRAFSGPDLVELGSAGRPTIIRLNVGPQGNAATVAVGTTTTGAAGTNAIVTNSGTTSAAVFNFTIPRGDTGATGPNSVTSATTSDGTAILDVESITGIYIDGDVFTATSGTGTAVIGTSNSGIGASFYSQDNYGAVIGSAGGNSLKLTSVSGDYYIECENNFTTIESAIERVRGWFVWFYNTFTGRLKTADITANRDWTLPDASGTIALTTSNVSTATALETSRNIFGITFNGAANVVGDATNTGHFASIPTGGQAGHFITLNGTAPTVIAGRSAWWSDGSGNPSFRNGTGTAVTLVKSSDLGTNVANFLATPTSANLASALTDENGTGGGFVRAEGATLTSPSIAGTASFTGTTRPTSAGTGTPAATSLITRDDMSSLFQTFRLLRNFTEVKLMAVAFQGGSGSASISPSGTNWTQQRYATGAVIGSFAGANSLGSSNFSHPCPLAGTGATAINWGVRQRIFWKFSARTFAGCDYRLYWGGSQNTIGTGDSIVRCVGIKITGTSLFLQAHNGTAMTTSPSLLTVTSDIVYDMWIDCDGLGNASLWNSDTLLGTISGLATNNQTFNACFIDRVDNNATTSSAILSVYNRAILTGSLY